jgi:hypothetical protein
MQIMIFLFDSFLHAPLGNAEWFLVAVSVQKGVTPGAIDR